MKTLISLILLAFTLIAASEELPNFDGEYSFAVTGDEIALDAGVAKITTNAAGESKLSLEFANKRWEAPFVMREYKPKPGHTQKTGISPYFDVVFVFKDEDFDQTLILSGEYIDGNLSGQMVYHRGVFKRYKTRVFRTGTFLLKPIKKPNKSEMATPRKPSD